MKTPMTLNLARDLFVVVEVEPTSSPPRYKATAMDNDGNPLGKVAEDVPFELLGAALPVIAESARRMFPDNAK